MTEAAQVSSEPEVSLREYRLASARALRAQSAAHALDAEVARLRAEEARLGAVYYRTSSPRLAEQQRICVAAYLKQVTTYERYARDYERLAEREEQRAENGDA